jgi:very-short-patch-repair endonuclease
MRDDLIRAAHAHGGVLTRNQALDVVDRSILGKALKAHALIRPYPEVYVVPELAEDPEVRDRAALASVPNGAFSHTTALRIWGIDYRSEDNRRHITVNSLVHVRERPGIEVHRSRGFTARHVVVRRGLAVVHLERALIDSWPLLPEGDRRGPSITAVQCRLTTSQRLLAELALGRIHVDQAPLRGLFRLLELGCHSELELWGHDVVFDHRSLPSATLQHRVHTDAGPFDLDRAYLAELVGVELDGAAWHGWAVQRERDVHRDAALAAVGWLIVRFTHARLRDDPEGCRSRLRDILAARRQQLMKG